MKARTRTSLTASLAASLALVVAACTSNGHPKAQAGADSFAPVPTLSTAAGSTSPDLPNGVLVSIPLDGGPLAPAAGYGSMWITSHRGNTLYRLDPYTDKVIAMVDLGTEACSAAAMGYGRVWVSGCDSTLIVVDPRTNQTVGSVSDLQPIDVAFAQGKVWVPRPIDPRTLQPITNPVPHVNGQHMVSGGGSIWTADAPSGIVTQFDPRTGDVLHTYRAGEVWQGDNFVGFAGGYLWVSSGGEHIWRIDPRSHTVTVQTIRQLIGVPSPGAEGLAITFSGGNLLARGDKVYCFALPTLQFLGSYPAVDWTGGFATIAFGSLWVANLDGNTVWRDRLTPNPPKP